MYVQLEFWQKIIVIPIMNPLSWFMILYYMICYFLQDGYTPIHLASRCGHVQVVEKLLSLGADFNVVNKVSVNY